MSPDAARTLQFDTDRLEIRPLDASHLDRVLGMVEILDEAPRWSRSEYENMLRADAARPRIALVACDTRNGEVVGFAVASLLPSVDPPEAELESIAVAQAAQRRGVGRRLLASLVTQLRTSGTGELHLEVRASNLAAIRFYQAQNFIQTGVRPRYYNDPEEDAVLMTLSLA
jgi:[ribosomal protein S18]-alanine N-acetyltransferase